MVKAKDIFKKFTVAAIATVGIVLAGNSLQAQAETIKPEEMTLASDVPTSEDDNLYEESFGSIDELPDGSWIEVILFCQRKQKRMINLMKQQTTSIRSSNILMLTHQEIKPVVVEALDTNTTTGTRHSNC